MKKLLLFAILCFSVFQALAQRHLQWTTFEVTPHMEINDNRGMATDKNGYTYFIDFTQSNIDYYMTYRFFCYDANGVKKWQYDNDSCFTDCNDIYNTVLPLDDSGAIFVGYYETLSGVVLRLKRIALNGNLVWQKDLTGSYQKLLPVASHLDKDGNVVIALDEWASAVTSDDYGFAKFSRAGNLLWHTILPPDSGSTGAHIAEVISDMVVGPDNNIYACGTSTDEAAGTNVGNYLIKLSSTGSLDYKVLTNISDSGADNKIIVDGVGNISMLGSVFTSSYLETRKATDGSFLWLKPIKLDDSATVTPVGFTHDVSNSIYVLSDYKHLLKDTVGGHFSHDEYMVSKYSPTGSLNWQKSYFTDTSAATSDDAIQISACNDYLYVTSEKNEASGHAYILLQKMNINGTNIWHDSAAMDYKAGNLAFDNNCNVYLSYSSRLGHSSIVNVTRKFTDYPATVTTIANDHSVSIYPNPANERVTLSYNSVTDASSIAVLYDINGRTVKSISLKGDKAYISTASLPAGLYVCKMIINGQITANKISIQH